jgi:hypothetical protein
MIGKLFMQIQDDWAVFMQIQDDWEAVHANSG